MKVKNVVCYNLENLREKNIAYFDNEKKEYFYEAL